MEQQQGFEVEVSIERDVRVVSVRGELDIATSPVLRAELDGSDDGEDAALLIDLTEVAFIDSTGLRLLCEAANRTADGAFAIACVDAGPLDKLLDIARVRDLLRPYPDRGRALDALSGQV